MLIFPQEGPTGQTRPHLTGSTYRQVERLQRREMKYSATESLFIPPSRDPKEFVLERERSCAFVGTQMYIMCPVCVRKKAHGEKADTHTEGVQAVCLTVSLTVCHNKLIEAAPLCLPLPEYYICRWLEEFCLTGRQRAIDSALTRKRRASVSQTMKASSKKTRYDEKLATGPKFITTSETKCWWQPSDRCWLAFLPRRPASPRSSSDSRAYFCQQSSARAYFMTRPEQTCLRAQRFLRAKARAQDSTSPSDTGPTPANIRKLHIFTLKC